MTAEEVIEYFAPARSSVDAVIGWLIDAGVGPTRISQSANKQVSIVLNSMVQHAYMNSI